MPFTPIETLSMPGDAAKANEDSLILDTGFVAVFDGSTGLGDPLLPGPSDAHWIAHFGARRLAAHMREGAPLREALRRAAADAEHSYQGLRRRAPEARYEWPFAALMAVCPAAGMLDAMWLGDCAALLRAPDGSVRMIGDTLAARASERARAAAVSGGDAPAGPGIRARFLPALRVARNQVNTAKGGWLFGPDPACASHAASACATAAPGTLVLLATDGFLALVSDYGRYTPATLMEAASAKGLAALGRELRAIEAGDPQGTTYPRFKASDDATAVLLRIDP